MVVTNDERREVAARLRERQDCVGRDEDSPELTKWDDLAAIVLDPERFRACMRFKNRDTRTQAIRSVIAGRLADLIEPSCDRNALLDMEDEMFESATGLALISEMEEDADLKDLQTTMAKVLFGYARRIREACGMVDAG